MFSFVTLTKKSFMVEVFLIQNSTFMFSSFTCIPTGKRCRNIKIIISIIFFRLLMLFWAHFGMEQTLWFCVICTENALEMESFGATYKNDCNGIKTVVSFKPTQYFLRQESNGENIKNLILHCSLHTSEILHFYQRSKPTISLKLQENSSKCGYNTENSCWTYILSIMSHITLQCLFTKCNNNVSKQMTAPQTPTVLSFSKYKYKILETNSRHESLKKPLRCKYVP